jgi:Protein of unknown function (DUF1573)
MMFSTTRFPVFRKLLLFVFIFLASVPPVPAQTAVSNLHDFGKIAIDTPMKHTFEFHNEGSEVLVIRDVQMNPPLIVTKMTSRVEPGKTGSVTVELETPRQPGEFKGAVIVNFKSDAIEPLALWTTGELVPPIEFDPMAAFFVSTQRGEDKTTSIEITNHQPDPLEIVNVIHSSSRFTTKLETLQEGQHYRLSLTLSGNAPAGRQSEPITLVTSSRERPFLEVAAHTNINERVYTFPPAMDFETINVPALKARPEMARSFSAELTVYQKGGTNFQVSFVQTDVPFLRLTTFQDDLKDRFGIQVGIVPEKLRAGQVNGSIVITTNDPEFSRIVVPVTAVVEGTW